MKPKNILIAIMLILLLTVPAMALDMGMQTCIGLGYRSAEAGISEWVQARTVMQLSSSMFAFVSAGGTIENSAETQDYAIGAELGYLITQHLMMRFSTSYLRTSIKIDNATDVESPLISIGADYYFTNVSTDQNELIGATLSIVHNPNTKDTGLFVGAIFWFGKDNMK